MQFLGLKFIHRLHSGTFFHDMDSVIRDFLGRHMEDIVPRAGCPRATGPRAGLIQCPVWPVFERGTARLAAEMQAGKHVDVIPHVQFTMAEAKLSIFFGPVGSTLPSVCVRISC